MKSAVELEAHEKRRREGVLESLPWRSRRLIQRGQVEVTEQIEALLEWHDRDQSGGASNIAILAGAPGTGKTTAVAYLAAERFWSPTFITAAELARMSRFSDDRQQLLTNDGEIIVDDLGAEYSDGKGAFAADLDELVNVIYRGVQVAVITTNLSWPKFSKRYGARIADRLAEAGTWITFDGPSRRGGST